MEPRQFTATGGAQSFVEVCMSGRKGRKPDLTPVDVTPEEAWEVYKSLDEPTQSKAVKAIQQKFPGCKMSLSTLKKWSTKYDWVSRLAVEAPDKTDLSDTQRLNAVLRYLNVHHKMVKPDAVKGLQGLLLEKVRRDFELIELDSVEKIEHALEIVTRLQTLEHGLRGDAIKDRNDDEAGEADVSAPTENVIDYNARPKTLRSQVRQS
jgi:hypothetical protein